MYKPQQISQQSALFLNKRAKQNDSKYMNAIKPYVAKQRKVSKRQSKNIIQASHIENSKSKSRKNESSSRKLLENNISNSKHLGDVYLQLKALKSEYKSLKDAYQNMKKKNEELTSRENSENQQLQRNNEVYRKQIEKYQENISFLQQEMERMKKQCFRLLETQKFKNKKLEETLQEKELMIAYLRSQLAILNGESPKNNNSIFMFQHTAPAYKNNQAHFFNEKQPNLNSHIEINLPKQIHPNKKPMSVSTFLQQNSHLSKPSHSVLVQKNSSILKQSPEVSQIKQKRQYIFSNSDNSFSFSRERSKEESMNQSDGQQPTILTFTKKDVIVFEQSSRHEEIFQGRDPEVEQYIANEYYENDINEIEEISPQQSEQFEGSGEFEGQEQILTFENRIFKGNEVQKLPIASNSQIQELQIDSSKNLSKKNYKNPSKNQQFAKNKSHCSPNLSSIKNSKVKSRPNTKRLQIQTDDELIISTSKTEKEKCSKQNYGNGQFPEIYKKNKTKKKSASTNTSHTTRKRKSEEAGLYYRK